jgi:hypothetical protein
MHPIVTLGWGRVLETNCPDLGLNYCNLHPARGKHERCQISEMLEVVANSRVVDVDVFVDQHVAQADRLGCWRWTPQNASPLKRAGARDAAYPAAVYQRKPCTCRTERECPMSPPASSHGWSLMTQSG